MAYTVTEVRLIDKGAVPLTADLWQPVDGRLVLFTCLQRSSGRSLQNVVVVAERRTEPWPTLRLGSTRTSRSGR